MLASFDRHRFDQVTCPEPGKQTGLIFNNLMQDFFHSFALFTKICRKTCVEKYQDLNGVDF